MRLVFETKQTKTAAEIREWIQENLGVDCSVQVHPSNTIITFREPPKDLKKLYEWLAEEMDARLLGGGEGEGDTAIRNGRKGLRDYSASGWNEGYNN